MARITIASLKAENEVLAMKLKREITVSNSLRRKLETLGAAQAFDVGMNMRNPAFRAAFDALRAKQPTGVISKDAIIAAMRQGAH